MARNTLYISESTGEEARARFRERIAREVRRTELAPLDVASADDLAWAYQGHEAELAELEQQAAEVAGAEAKQREQAERSRALQAMTDQVLREQEAEEAAERRRKAEAEARKRLGWRMDERP